MIYFDNNATTRLAPEAFEAMKPFLQEFYGNSSSAHAAGRDARRAVEIARENVAELVGAADAGEIVFTSGGTESDNWAILGALEMSAGGKHIVTTSVEHEAVRKLCDKLERQNYEITRLETSENGFLDLDELKNSLRPETALVSIMTANNETGILFPVERIARVVRENSGALFHTDAVNAVGKIRIDLKNTEIDLLSLSGHKFHAPKGVGALYIKKNPDFPSFLIGGGQEAGRRAGTEAVHQIVALGRAAALVKDLSSMKTVGALRDRLEDAILRDIPNASLNGSPDRESRLPNTSSISFENTNGEAILARLDDAGVAVSTGSACNAENHVASVVLQALNVPYAKAMGAIRFSLGRYNTEKEIDLVCEILPPIVRELNALAD
jgi:cysteine desulfurase